jgi:hypothetical protein
MDSILFISLEREEAGAGILMSVRSGRATSGAPRNS